MQPEPISPSLSEAQDPGVSTSKEVLGQITGTGISGDYYNELIVPIMHYRDWNEGVDGAIRQIRERPIRLYTQRFSPDTYADVITEQNRDLVARIEEIASELNERANDGTLSDEIYRALHQEACTIVYGADRKEVFGDGGAAARCAVFGDENELSDLS